MKARTSDRREKRAAALRENLRRRKPKDADPAKPTTKTKGKKTGKEDGS